MDKEKFGRSHGGGIGIEKPRRVELFAVDLFRRYVLGGRSQI
jgi:hypothetical protein